MRNKTHPNFEKLQMLLFPFITFAILLGLAATVWLAQLFLAG